MKLSDFLKPGAARPAPTRPVKFKIVGFDQVHNAVVAEASAELAFVSESQRQEALRDARAAITKDYGEALPPDERIEDESKYHVLFHALKNSGDVRQPFADSVKELRQSLVLPEAARLWREYRQFEAEEFPEEIDEETFEKMVAEAKTLFLPDLISRYSSDVVKKCIYGLIARVGK